jgi:hypothetical protein
MRLGPVRRAVCAILLCAVVEVIPTGSALAAPCHWVEVPGAGGVADLQDVSALAPDDVWAVGSDVSTGQAITWHWAGSDWSAVPNPSLAGARLLAVTGVSSDDVWAVGSVDGKHGTVVALAEHWDGTVWTRFPTAVSGAGNDFLVAVSAISSDDVWAVGYTSAPPATDQALAEHWDGAHWSLAPVPAAEFLNGVAAISSERVWATVDSGTSAKLARWNGSSWKLFPTHVKLSSLQGIAARSRTDVWAVGHDFSAGGVLIMHWDGTSWTRTPAETPAFGGALSDVAIVSAGRAWAVGVTRRKPLIEKWDGADWTLTRPASKAGPLVGVARVPGTKTVWAVGVHIERSC